MLVATPLATMSINVATLWHGTLHACQQPIIMSWTHGQHHGMTATIANTHARVLAQFGRYHAIALAQIASYNWTHCNNNWYHAMQSIATDYNWYHAIAM